MRHSGKVVKKKTGKWHGTLADMFVQPMEKFKMLLISAKSWACIDFYQWEERILEAGGWHVCVAMASAEEPAVRGWRWFHYSFTVEMQYFLYSQERLGWVWIGPTRGLLSWTRNFQFPFVHMHLPALKAMRVMHLPWSQWPPLYLSCT